MNSQASRDVLNVSVNATPDELLSLSRDDGVQVEKIKASQRKMSVKEKLAFIEAESPELLQLLNDLKSKVDDVHQNITPVMEQYVKHHRALLLLISSTLANLTLISLSHSQGQEWPVAHQRWSIVPRGQVPYVDLTSSYQQASYLPGEALEQICS